MTDNYNNYMKNVSLSCDMYIYNIYYYYYDFNDASESNVHAKYIQKGRTDLSYTIINDIYKHFITNMMTKMHMLCES